MQFVVFFKSEFDLVFYSRIECVAYVFQSSDFVESFLHLCKVWGDMQIVFLTYESTPRKVAKQVGATGNSPTNLVYLHSYLSDYHWNLIAQRVANFGNENCICRLVSISTVVYKMRRKCVINHYNFTERSGPSKDSRFASHRRRNTRSV